MRAAVWLLVPLVASGCSMRARQPDCGRRPDSFATWRALRGGIDGLQANIIRVGVSGELSWNGTGLATPNDRSGLNVLDRYLTIVPQLRPMPATSIVFDKGAPCVTLDRVRALMEQRLACAAVRAACLQGPVPGRG